MTTATDARTTPLHSFHAEHGGKFVEFAGWTMPMTYAWPTGGGGVHDEHKQTRTSGGFFDVSHMGRVYISGVGARRLCEKLVTRRVSDMTEGQCRYALMCNGRGGIMDDVLVYRLDDDEFMIVCNASNREKVVNHMRRVADDSGFKAKFDDKTESTAMVAIQGPRVMEIVSKVSREVPTLKRYRFVEKNLMIMKLLVSRTGYTGEDGVEVILPAKAVGMAMKMLLKDAGSADAIVKPCGLGARDTLRMEAGMPLYGHELGEDTNALSTGLGFAMNLDKHEDERGEKFIGQDALLETQASGGPRQTLVGLFVEGKRTARQHMKLLKDGKEVGEITSGCMSPTLERPIAMAYVNKELAEPGTTLDIDLGREKTTGAEVTPLPFYKAPKK